jgi:hypothetical protein
MCLITSSLRLQSCFSSDVPHDTKTIEKFSFGKRVPDESNDEEKIFFTATLFKSNYRKAPS